MKFELENKKLQDLLNYLKVDTLFPTCVLSTKKQKLYSSQTEAYGYAFRFALFDKPESYVEIIDSEHYLIKDWEVLGKGDVYARKEYIGRGTRYTMYADREHTTFELVHTPK